jgi:hypothetical protein
MAKSTAKTPAKEPRKPAVKASKPKASSSNGVEKASVDALDKLRALGVNQELQNDLEWCLGSYRADGNPVGLYTMLERAVDVLKTEKEKKTKGVTAKLITDLERAIQNR